MGDQKIDAEVESFFSKFDNEELVNFSDSSSEEKEVEKDVKVEAELKQEKETSKTAEKKEDLKEEDNTPFHKHPRWQQKLEENKKLKEQVSNWEREKQELLERLEKLESKPLTDEELENMSPKEIQEYTRKQLEKESLKKSELDNLAKQEAERYIEDTLEAIRDTGFDLTKDKENEILKIAQDYTQGDIEKAFELYNKLNQTKEEAKQEEAKEIAKKQSAQSNRNNRGTGQVSGFVRGTSWNSLNLK